MADAYGSKPAGGTPGTPARSPGIAAAHPGDGGDVTATGARSRMLQLAARWWPALVGLTLGIVSLLDLEPWRPSDTTTVLLPGLAVLYLLIGAARRQLGRPGILKLQIVGLVIYGGCALLAVFLGPGVGQYLVGAGWMGHAAWDVAHHRDLSQHHAVGVVPRGYAEYCIVLDLLIGASLIAAPTV